MHAMLNMQTTDLCNRICNHTGEPGIAVHMRMMTMMTMMIVMVMMDDIDGNDDDDDDDDDDADDDNDGDHWFRQQGSK